MFWDEIRSIEEFWKEKKSIIVSNLPAQSAAKCIGVLYQPQISKMKETVSLEGPLPIFKAGIEATCRLADKLHAKKTALTPKEVITRLGKEIDAVQNRK